MKKKDFTFETIVNKWLAYHSKTVEDVKKEHPESVTNPIWFSYYKVTQEQHDEWYEWFIEETMKTFKIKNKEQAKKYVAMDYLNVSPSIIINNENI